MKTRFNRSATVMMTMLGLMLFGLAPDAQAVATLGFIVDGGAPIFCADQAACDANNVVGAVTFVGALGGVYSVNVTTGITKPVLPGAHMDLNSVNVNSTAGGTHQLLIGFSETGYDSTGLGFIATFGGTQNFTGGSTIEAAAWFDVGNTLFATTTLIGTTGPLAANPFAASFSGPGPASSPYSLTQILTLNSTGTGTFSGDFELTQIPEPTTVALFGGILLLTGAAIRRRASKV